MARLGRLRTCGLLNCLSISQRQGQGEIIGLISTAAPLVHEDGELGSLDRRLLLVWHARGRGSCSGQAVRGWGPPHTGPFQANVPQASPPSGLFNPSKNNSAVPPGVYVASSAFPSDSSWYPDSGASNHVTADKENLAFFKEYSGSDNVHIGNGQGLLIKHIGHSFFTSP